jgi:hypothetical protein
MQGLLNKKVANIRLFDLGVGLFLSIVFIAVGSFADFGFSERFVHLGNAIGKWSIYLAPLPGYALLGSVGVLFLINWDPVLQKDSRFLAWACAAIFPLLAGSLYGNEAFSSLTSNKYLAVILGIALVAFFDVGIYFLFRKGDKDEAYRAGVTILFSSVIVTLLVFLLQKVGMRPNYEFLAAKNDFSHYRNWWSFDASLAAVYSADGTAALDSWPSVSISLSMSGILFALLCQLNDFLKTKSRFFIYGTYLFVVLFSLGEISEGAAYISDCAFGAFFSLFFSGMVIYLSYFSDPSEEALIFHHSPSGNNRFVQLLSHSPRRKQIQADLDKKKPSRASRKKAYRRSQRGTKE